MWYYPIQSNIKGVEFEDVHENNFRQYDGKKEQINELQVNRYSVNLIITSLHHFQAKISFFMKKPKEREYKIFMGARNVSFDVCKILAGTAHSIFWDILAVDIHKYSNVFQPCPVSVINEPERMNLYLHLLDSQYL